MAFVMHADYDDDNNNNDDAKRKEKKLGFSLLPKWHQLQPNHVPLYDPVKMFGKKTTRNQLKNNKISEDLLYDKLVNIKQLKMY